MANRTMLAGPPMPIPGTNRVGRNSQASPPAGSRVPRTMKLRMFQSNWL
jgi:hypothetical protein